MRVTTRSMIDGLIANLQASQEAQDRLQNQITSGKRVNRPSDDPTASWRGMRLRDASAANTQYLRNMDDARAWLNTTDSALDGVQATLSKIRELAVQVSNDTYNAADRAEVSSEVSQLREHLFSLFNSTNNSGQYVFSGMRTGTPAFTKDAAGNVLYQGDASTIFREIGPGTTMPVNTLADQFVTTFSDVQDLANELVDPQGSSIKIAASIAKLDQAIEQVLNSRSDVGSKLVRIDFATDRISNQQVEIGQVQSTNEDVDLADVLSKLTTQQSVYRITLEAAGRVMPYSLMDFLK